MTQRTNFEYLVTMKHGVIDLLEGQYEQNGYTQLRAFIREKIEKNGQPFELYGEKLHALKIEFQDEPVPRFLERYCKALSEEDREIMLFDTDFSDLSESEMWELVYFFIKEGQMGVFHYIGATLINR